MPDLAPDVFDNWTVQLRKGLLELCILNALAAGERYGYDLVRALVAVPGLGITEGTLYPLLSRLRVQGLLETRLVESSEGPARKYYRLTRSGKDMVALMNLYFRDLLAGVRQLQQAGGPP
jgi:PadR family transcriptional regulator, regulatory protein PadR